MIAVWYHAAAEYELLDAVSYLEARAKGLGRRFLTEVRRVEDQISDFHESAPEVVPGIRRCVLRKFPYSPVYSVEDDKAIVPAVAHHRRVPQYWAARMLPETEDS